MAHLTRRHFAFSVAAALIGRAQEAEDLTALSLTEASARIRSRTLTSTQLVEAYVARIDIYNPKVNAYITVMREQALAQAKELDAAQAVGKFRGPLHGIPIGLKDNIDTAGTRTTAASALFDDRVPEEDAEVVRRLKAAGAVLIGKTNLNEFALGGTSATTYFGPVRNPWALDRHPGGSSGGSGAAVAAGLCSAALGTDTTGSVRGPAAHCGIVGLKPTYGLIPIRGIIPLTFSLDSCGPMTHTVEDAAILLNALAGYDKLDISSVEHPKEDYVEAMRRQSVSEIRVGLPRAPLFDLLDADISGAVEEAIRVLSKLVKSVKVVALPSTNNVAAGLRPELLAYHEEFFKLNAGLYQRRARILMRDRNISATEYIRARWELELMRRTVDDAFTDFDLVVFPTHRTPPSTVEEALKIDQSDDPRNPRGNNNAYVSVCGLPAISVPCGFTRRASHRARDCGAALLGSQGIGAGAGV